MSEYSIYGVCSEQKTLQSEKRGFSRSWRIPPKNKMPGIGAVEKMVVHMRAGILLGDLQQKSSRHLTKYKLPDVVLFLLCEINMGG